MNSDKPRDPNLIPITVSVFGAKQAGSRGQAMTLSGLYVFGIAVMYSSLGIGAALTDERAQQGASGTVFKWWRGRGHG